MEAGAVLLSAGDADTAEQFPDLPPGSALFSEALNTVLAKLFQPGVISGQFSSALVAS